MIKELQNQIEALKLELKQKDELLKEKDKIISKIKSENEILNDNLIDVKHQNNYLSHQIDELNEDKNYLRAEKNELRIDKDNLRQDMVIWKDMAKEYLLEREIWQTTRNEQNSEIIKLSVKNSELKELLSYQNSKPIELNQLNSEVDIIGKDVQDNNLDLDY